MTFIAPTTYSRFNLPKPRVRFADGVWTCRSGDGFQVVHGAGTSPRAAYNSWYLQWLLTNKTREPGLPPWRKDPSPPYPWDPRVWYVGDVIPNPYEITCLRQ